MNNRVRGRTRFWYLLMFIPHFPRRPLAAALCLLAPLASAQTAFLRALEFNPRYGRALYALSVLLVFEMDRPEDAGPYLTRLLEIEKQNVDAMFLLARVRYSEGRLEDAAKVEVELA